MDNAVVLFATGHASMSILTIPTTDEQGGDSNGGELAELTSTEISLDLQGLIDDANFNDDNLFGDLGDAKRNELNSVYHQGVQQGHHNGAREDEKLGSPCLIGN